MTETQAFGGEMRQFAIRRTHQILESFSVKLTTKGGIYLAKTLEHLLTEPNATIAEALALLAKQYGIGIESVRGAIRHAVTAAWNRGDAMLQYRYFLHSVEFKRGKPTEAAFISTLALSIKHEMEEYAVLKAEHDGIPPEMRLQER